MKVAIIKYNAGNIRSVSFALKRIGVDPIVTDNIEDLNTADKIIFPGVGEASSAMRYLRDKQLDKVICNFKQPVLGICLGMQLFCENSAEGNTDCLGVFKQKVLRFSDANKVPQIGWNTIENLNSKIFDRLKEQEFMYFVHGYYVEKSENTIAIANYGIEYSAAWQKGNFYGVQFHPEKSSDAGQLILENFLNL
ncbi:MAG: imidazole glycerol phosphate synthase subunit HisH [Bacteroidetes bacterium]|nr:imidazole glycerol phosphate synthase subunit HisH [Bacteroidota bacterium]